MTIPVEEATYFVSKSRQVAIVTASTSSRLGEAIVTNVNNAQNSNIESIGILSNLPDSSLRPSQILISTDHYMDDNAAGVVIFTSGTTGRPKGAVMRRAFVHDSSLSTAEHWDVTHGDVILHVLPVHHATGIGISFLPFLMSGALTEFKSGSFDPEWMWNRWKKGGLTFFSGVPTIYMRMMRFFEQRLSKLPEPEKQEFILGARKFRVMLCGSSALPTPMQNFWTNLRGGQRILTRYGGTEFGAIFKMPLKDDNTPDSSVGPSVAGVDVKLSDGEEGEVLVKSPWMFSKCVTSGDIVTANADESRYLFDDKATLDAHDSEGYYKTGDIARREGKNYFILGRASMDIIKSGGYKISALDIERECLGLSYVSEAMVCGVADEEFGQRVAVAITLRDDQEIYTVDGRSGRQLTLEELRTDLRNKLVGYKLPTLLRVLEGDLPKGPTGKVLKKILGPQLFPSPGWEEDAAIQSWRSGGLTKASRL